MGYVDGPSGVVHVLGVGLGKSRVWAILVPGLMLAGLLLAGCGVIGGRAKWQSEVVECASSAAIADYQEVGRGWDRSQFEIGFLGQPSDDPAALVRAPGLRLEVTDEIPEGPYVSLAAGSVLSEDVRCSVTLSQLEAGLSPPDHLRVDDVAAAEIVRGQREVLRLTFSRYHE